VFRTLSSTAEVWFASVNSQPIVKGILASSYGRLQQEVASALDGVEPERIICIEYAVSRLFGVLLQHHALIVLRAD